MDLCPDSPLFLEGPFFPLKTLFYAPKVKIGRPTPSTQAKPNVLGGKIEKQPYLFTEGRYGLSDTIFGGSYFPIKNIFLRPKSQGSAPL